MTGNERRNSGRGGLRGDHPEGFGKDRRRYGDLGERQQVDQVTVLERAREEHVHSGHALQLCPVVAEAHHDRLRVQALEHLEQQVYALVLEQLAHVDDRRARLREEGPEALGVARIGQALVGAAGVGRIAPSFLEQRRERLLARLRLEGLDVDAGRHLENSLLRPDHLLERAAEPT